MTTQAWYMKNNGMNGVVFIQPDRADRYILADGNGNGVFDGVDLYSDDAAEQLHGEYASRRAGDWDLSHLYAVDMIYQAPVGELFDDPDITMILVAEFDYDDDFAEVIA